MLSVSLRACQARTILPLATAEPAGGIPAHLVVAPIAGKPCPPCALPRLAVGTALADGAGQALLSVAGHAFLPAPDGGHALECPLVEACMDLPAGVKELVPTRTGVSLAWVTLSDKGSRGEREDASGPAIEAMVRGALPLSCARGYLLPDDGTRLRGLLTALALEEGFDLVITTGGTGVGPRDVTPQATARVLDLTLPGFAQAMMQASLQKTPRAVISRAMAGVIGRTLVINLPGSRRAVMENLEAVLPALGHTLDKLRGDEADCGS